jgi:hypothetical protein
MQNYKITVSKNLKRFTIFLKAENEVSARERVHKEWYSILTIEEAEQKNNIWNVFLFSWYNKNWELKNGKIVWDDIFKTYIKLRKSLEYDVIYLFSENDKNITDEEKQKIIIDLKEEFLLLYKNKSNIIKEKQNRKKEKQEKDNYLKKELEETDKLISFILEKLNKVITNQIELNIDNFKKEKLKNIYNWIIKLKKSTNIIKKREIWIIALEKLGSFELEELENNNKQETKELIKETNILLKKLWSNKNFIEKHKDISYIINSFFEWLNQYFLDFKQKHKKEKKQIDKKSHSYAKNQLFLKKYKEKLWLNTVYIIKNLIKLLLNKNDRQNTFIRRKVIKQNIILFEAKEKGIGFSYTYIKKGISRIFNIILSFLINLKYYILLVIFSFILLFIVIFNINYYFNFQDIWYIGIFYLIVLLLIYILLNINKNLILMIFNFVILFFIVIFGVVNF